MQNYLCIQLQEISDYSLIFSTSDREVKVLASELRMPYWARSQTTKMMTLGVQRSHLFYWMLQSGQSVVYMHILLCVCPLAVVAVKL